MKLVSKGLVNKILSDIDDEKVNQSKEPVDSMGLAFQTDTNPYGKNTRLRRSPFSDPSLFIVHFQRIL